MHPDEADAYAAGYPAAIQEQRPWHHRHRFRWHDGAWRTLDSYASPLTGPDGTHCGHVGVAIDITEHERATAAL